MTDQGEDRPSDGGIHPLSPGAGLRSWSVVILACLGLAAALYLGRSFFAPVLAAILLAYLFLPIVRRLTGVGVSPYVGAALVLLGLIGAGWFAITRFQEPAARWMEELPQVLREAEPKLRLLWEPVEQVAKAAESIEEVTGDGAREPGEIEVVSKNDGALGARILTGIGELVTGLVITGFLLFFLLGDDNAFLRALVRILPTLGDKKIAVDVVRSIEREVARYLTTITLINLALGAAVGVAMHALGVPNPGLWGIVAALLNFVPYLGAMVGIAVVGAVALVTFETPRQFLAPPAVYLMFTSLEGMLFTPMILGRRFLLRPTVVFLWLVLWTGLLGIPGALIAIPLLVVGKIVCEHVPSLTPIAVFIGQDERRAGPAATAESS